MNDAQRLLADYVKTGSEAAFRELVARYVNLVHSTAARLVDGDTQLAEDITQAVFVDLARKARTLPREVMLGGWLHRDTCFVARTTLRGERRRQFRERQVAAMSIPEDHTAANLALVAPLLDEAIDQLEQEDRQAVMLRFFEQLDYRAVGEAIGSNEDAARMRVSRALDKLQAMLKNRGVALSAAALGAALGVGAVTAAPFGLAATVAGGALAGVASANATAGAVKFLALTKLKLAMVGAIAAVALAVPLVLQHQSLEKLRQENQALQQQAAQLDALQAENDKLSNLVVQASLRPSPTEEQARELARLRNAVGKLRDQTNEMGGQLAELRALDRSSFHNSMKRPFHKITMAEFAKFIAGVLQAPVADQTGLTGTYDIEITPLRVGGEEGKLERVTSILLNDVGLQLVPFAGPFTAEEQDFYKEEPQPPVQMPDGSYSVVTKFSSPRARLDGGFALKLDHTDAPGLKPSTDEPDSAAGGLTPGNYNLDTPGLPAAVANKLRLIGAAKQQWALEFRKESTETPTWHDIEPYLSKRGGDISEYTNSPDGRYIIGAVGSQPQIHANALAPDDPVTRKINACINNLRLIDSSKQQWALEFRKQNTDTPTADDLRPYLGRGEKGELPTCPDGGTYTFGTVGEKPTCSVQSHALP